MSPKVFAAVLAAILIPVLPGTAFAGTGTLGSTAADPAAGCGNPCTAVVDDSEAAPAAGTITRWSLRHAQTPAGTTATLRVLVAVNNGYAYQVQRSGPTVELQPGAGPQTSTFDVPGGLAIAAGEYIGVSVRSTGGGTPLIFATAGPGYSSLDGDVQDGQSSAGGQWAWASLTSGRLLVSGEVQGDGYGATSGGGGTSGGGDAGGGQSGTTEGGLRYCGRTTATRATVASTSVARDGGELADEPGARAARRWPGKVISRAGNASAYLGATVAFDNRGRRWVALHQNNPHQVVLVGPSGRRVLGPVEFSTRVGLAITRGGPLVTWRKTLTESEAAAPGMVGLMHICDVLFGAIGPKFEATALATRPDDDSGYQFQDVAFDASSGKVHLAHEVGRNGQLVHRELTGAITELPMTGVLGVRVAAGRGTVAVAASNGSALKVFVRRGKGAWRAKTIAARPGSWDMQLGSDRRPRLAFRQGLNLSLFNGRRRVRTRLPADQVALALGRGNVMHVAFTKVGGPNCFGFISRRTCVANGLFHLRANARASRGRVSTVQSSIGDSPSLSIAVRGRRVAIAFPWVGGTAMLRQR